MNADNIQIGDYIEATHRLGGKLRKVTGVVIGRCRDRDGILVRGHRCPLFPGKFLLTKHISREARDET